MNPASAEVARRVQQGLAYGDEDLFPGPVVREGRSPRTELASPHRILDSIPRRQDGERLAT